MRFSDLRKKFSPTFLMEVIIVAYFAGFIVFLFGRTGFGFFDKSFFMEISQRLLHGQKMYVDIGGIPHAPLTYYVQAAFFYFFGVSLFSCLLHASVFNAVAAVLIYVHFSRRLASPWPFLLGLLSAIWFYGIISWPWVERLGILGALIAYFIWEELGESSRKAPLKLFIIGMLTALPLWDKQNLALMMALTQAFLLYRYCKEHKHWDWVLVALSGYALVAGGLLIFFFINGFEGTAYEYFGRSASYNRFSVVFEDREFRFTTWTFLILTAMGLATFQKMGTEQKFPQKWRCLLLISLICLQSLNAPLTSSRDLNDFALMGLIWGWFLFIFAEPDKGNSKKALVFPWKKQLVVVAAFSLFFLEGGYQAYLQTIWRNFAFPFDTEFAPITHPFFKGFSIQQPQGKEVDEALHWMEANIPKDQIFWTFPSYGIFYPAMERVSDAPVVTWELGSIQNSSIGTRDEQRTLDWLKSKRPPWVIINLKPVHPSYWQDVGKILQKLPQLSAYLSENYKVVAQTNGGAFQFFHLREKP